MPNDKKKYLIIFVLLTVTALAGVGYFSAAKKSAPQYLSKIDKIMFEKKNKSPKFVLTLPDNEKKTEIVSETKEDVSYEESNPKTVDDLLNIIPIVTRLPAAKNQLPLSVIDIDNNFIEKDGDFSLPKIASNGTKPWVKYGRQVDVQPKFYRVSVVLKNIGLDKTVTDAAVTSMPSEVALSFSPYTLNAAEKIKQARTAGHETYVDLLLAAKDPLKSDNGPLSLSITSSSAENMEKVKRALSLGGAIGGMIINDGASDTDFRDQLKNILSLMKDRGILMVDATIDDNVSKISENGLARKKADIIIDSGFNRKNIESLMKKAENIAQNNGSVLIVATPKPIVMTVLHEWFETFSPQLSYEQMKEQNITQIERPFALVPVSNMVVE